MRVPVGQMTARQIMEKYSVSRATAYLGLKRGYICPGYHERQIQPDPKRAEEMLDMIVMIAEQTLWRNFSWIKNRADARQEAILGLLELAGHPDFGNRNWMITVAVNRLRDFARKEAKYLKMASLDDREVNFQLLIEDESFRKIDLGMS